MPTYHVSQVVAITRSLPGLTGRRRARSHTWRMA